MTETGAVRPNPNAPGVIVTCPKANQEHELIPVCPICQKSLELHVGWVGQRVKVAPELAVKP